MCCVSGVVFVVDHDIFPQVQLYKWTTKAYTPANGIRLFDAVNAKIVSKGYQGFK